MNSRQQTVTGANGRMAPQGWWARLVHRLRRWNELAAQRRQLARLDAAAMKDLGLSRADVLAESQRPFWDDPQLGRPVPRGRGRGQAWRWLLQEAWLPRLRRR